MTIENIFVTVTTAATPVPITGFGGGDVTKVGRVYRKMIVQANPANTGRIYVGTTALAIGSNAGLIVAIGKDPASANELPRWEIEDPNGSNSIDPSLFRIDATVSGEDCYVTLIQT